MIVNISPTPSNTASNTPTNTNSGTPCPSNSATPTITLTNTATPTNTATQTITPTMTPTPFEVCPTQMTINKITGAWIYPNQTYNRITSYTGGTFSGGYVYFNGATTNFIPGATSGGTLYSTYGIESGGTYYNLVAYTSDLVAYRWQMFATTGDYYISKGTNVSNNLLNTNAVLNSTTIGGITYPNPGRQNTGWSNVVYPSSCPTATPTTTPTLTPSPTYCADPKAIVLFDGYSGRTSLNAWMLSQGSAFRGLFINTPSLVQSTFQAQMNAYISYTGFGITTYSLIQSGITYNQDPIQILNYDNRWTDDFTWVSFFAPMCARCEGSYTLIGNATPSYTTNPLFRIIPFYYSGTSIPQGWYNWYSTYGDPAMRQNDYSNEYSLGSLVCSGITPTPTITSTSTPSSTPSMTATQTQTSTPTNTPTQTLTPTCGTYTTQYLNSEIQGNDNIKFTLFDNPNFTGNANAVCDYLISGTYNITSGAINVPYSTIMVYNDHTHTYNTGAGNISGFTVSSVSAACPCVNVIFNQITPTPTYTSTPTPTYTPTTTSNIILCPTTFIEGSYSGLTEYTYPNQPISSSVDNYIRFDWEVRDRPNRFSVYDSTGLLWTSDWVGQASYVGPWGASLNTAVFGSDYICFNSPSGRYVEVKAGNAAPTPPQLTDAYAYTIVCLGSCITPTPSMTQTSTPTNTQTCCAIEILTNGSLDVDITAVDVDGSAATYVGGQPLPNEPGNGTSLCSTNTGTVDIRVSVFNSVPGQKITLCDSNGTCVCQNITGTGPSNYDWFDVVFNCGTPVTIIAEDGSC